MKDLHIFYIDFGQTGDCMKMSQYKYLSKILDRFNMVYCRPRVCEENPRYSGDPEEMNGVRKYSEAVGSWIHLATCT